MDREKWEKEAWRFVEESARILWSKKGERALKYLRDDRGLQDETISDYLLGFNPVSIKTDAKPWGYESGTLWMPGGILIPCIDELQVIHYLKVRQSSGPKYVQVTGSQGWLFGGSSFIGKKIGFLFESEFDVMLGSQTGYNVGYASLPANQKLKSDDYQKYFDTIEDVIVAFDNDGPGQGAANDLCEKSPRFHKAGKFPEGNDLGEYSRAGGSVVGYLIGEVKKI